MSKKVLLTMALSLVALFATAAGASAYTATVEPAGEIETVSNGKVDFTASGITIECNLTLAGWLEETVANAERAGSYMGEITEVNWSECVGGSVRAVLGLEWAITTSRINGTLPNGATSLDFVINGAEFQLSVFGGFINCLYSGNAAANMAVSGSNPYSSGTITTNSSYTLQSGFLCPNPGSMVGSFEMEPGQTITLS